VHFPLLCSWFVSRHCSRLLFCSYRCSSASQAAACRASLCGLPPCLCLQGVSLFPPLLSFLLSILQSSFSICLSVRLLLEAKHIICNLSLIVSQCSGAIHTHILPPAFCLLLLLWILVRTRCYRSTFLLVVCDILFAVIEAVCISRASSLHLLLSAALSAWEDLCKHAVWAIAPLHVLAAERFEMSIHQHKVILSPQSLEVLLFAFFFL
jgi:hypothetical protein